MATRMYCYEKSPYDDLGKEIFEDGKRYGDEYKVVVFDKNNLEYVKKTILNHDWHNFKNTKVPLI